MLLVSAPHAMAAQLVGTPRALQHVMDCLLEREMLRNEALHLLAPLTSANRQAADMVAFEVAPRGQMGWRKWCPCIRRRTAAVAATVVLLECCPGHSLSRLAWGDARCCMCFCWSVLEGS